MPEISLGDGGSRQLYTGVRTSHSRALVGQVLLARPSKPAFLYTGVLKGKAKRTPLLTWVESRSRYNS